MKKTILLWFLTFLLTGVADAQAIQDFTFSHLGADEGLLNQRIYTIWQTADHALWWSSSHALSMLVDAALVVEAYQRRVVVDGQFRDEAGITAERLLRL